LDANYPHITGQTVIGGYVYRGSRIPLCDWLPDALHKSLS